MNKALQTSDPYEQQKLFEEANLYELARDEQKLTDFNYEAQEDFTAYEESAVLIEEAKKSMNKNSLAAEGFRLEEKSTRLYVQAQTKLSEANSEADPLVKINKTNEAREIAAYARLKQKEALKKYKDSARKPENELFADNSFEVDPSLISVGETAEIEGEDELVASTTVGNTAISVDGNVQKIDTDTYQSNDNTNDNTNSNSSGGDNLSEVSKSEYYLAYEKLITEAQHIEAQEEQRKTKIEELKFLGQTNKVKSENALSEAEGLPNGVEKNKKIEEANSFREQAEEREVAYKKEEYYSANNLTEAKSKRKEAELILAALSENEKDRALVLNGGEISYPSYDHDDTKGTYSPSTMAEKDGFKVITTSRYNSRTVIPVDISLPSGLVYKVQVGAFRQKINPAMFNGITPLSGEKTSAGITRYTAGLFKSFHAADMAKGRIRNLGYSDAFVVAFFDGRRINMEGADDKRNNATADEQESYAVNEEKEVKALKKLGITEAEAKSTGGGRANPIDKFSGIRNRPRRESGTAASARNINDVNGVYYTVQIGVYSSTRTNTQLFNITPLQTFNTSNGYIRYSTGVYRDINEANERRDEVRAKGVTDAYVVTYKNGQRIKVNEATSSSSSGANSNSMESANSTSNNNQNEVSSTGVIFKVQIAAFRKQIDIANNATLSQLSSFGIEYTATASGLLLYTAGSFTTKSDADELRTQIVSLGISDAFIVAFNNGKKISVRSAIALTN